jgi:hypothetical protein
MGILLLAVRPAVAQDDTMILESPELASHSRARVRFEHEKHAEKIECAACHHDYDEYGVNTDDDGQRCAVCHQSGTGAGAVPLMRAFHLQCKGCHAKIAAKGDKAGPLMCGQCHVRRLQ